MQTVKQELDNTDRIAQCTPATRIPGVQSASSSEMFVHVCNVTCQLHSNHRAITPVVCCGQWDKYSSPPPVGLASISTHINTYYYIVPMQRPVSISYKRKHTNMRVYFIYLRMHRYRPTVFVRIMSALNFFIRSSSRWRIMNVLHHWVFEVKLSEHV